MKKLLLITFCLSWLHLSAQKLTVKSSANNELVYVLNNLEGKFSTYTNNNDLFITVYLVRDVSGSAGDESCEANNLLYIATSEDGEAPEQHLFKLTNIYNPKFVRWIKKPKPEMIFTYGAAGHKKTATIAVSLKGVSILKS